MKETNDILQSYERAKWEGKKCALATVVHVEGSSYRRPGARMLITDDGQLTGAISGGCLEGDALRKALFAITQGENKLVTYDTTQADDLQFGVQLGCDGIVHILFEPIDENKRYHPIRLLKELACERRDAVLVTLFSLERSQEQPGMSLLYTGSVVHTLLSAELQDLLIRDAKTAMADKVSRIIDYRATGHPLTGFIEFVPPPPSIVIAGAGNDAQPLVEITSMLGWHTTVVDGRLHYATPQRFGKADRVLVAKPRDVLGQLDVDAQTFFVLMTHNYNYDLALLRDLVVRGFSYIGILGPKKRLDRMLAQFRQEGLMLLPEQIASIHSPIGLDIGAETAWEIAISIVAEIKAAESGRSGAPLKEKREPIHSRLPSDRNQHLNLHGSKHYE
ncbi:MAG: XdhC family protein [Bacteroidota bacterium]|nr:XdhC family protein [Bacteroidota bacterium]